MSKIKSNGKDLCVRQTRSCTVTYRKTLCHFPSNNNCSDKTSIIRHRISNDRNQNYDFHSRKPCHVQAISRNRRSNAASSHLFYGVGDRSLRSMSRRLHDSLYVNPNRRISLGFLPEESMVELMKSFGKTLWEILFFRSPAQAAKPNVTPQPPDEPFTPSIPEQQQPIERSYDIDSFDSLKMGTSDSAGKDAFGQLVRGHTTHHVQLGCHHLVSQIQPTQTETQQIIRGVAGGCYYCQLEIQQEQQRRIAAGESLVPPDDAIRLTLVCSECARMSVSGKLCCPRHSRIMDDGGGTRVCYGVDELESEAKKASLMRILTPLLGLFTEDTDVSAKQTTEGAPPPDKVKPHNDR